MMVVPQEQITIDDLSLRFLSLSLSPSLRVSPLDHPAGPVLLSMILLMKKLDLDLLG